jgi:hypothetical protein
MSLGRGRGVDNLGKCIRTVQRLIDDIRVVKQVGGVLWWISEFADEKTITISFTECD